MEGWKLQIDVRMVAMVSTNFGVKHGPAKTVRQKIWTSQSHSLTCFTQHSCFTHDLAFLSKDPHKYCPFFFFFTQILSLSSQILPLFFFFSFLCTRLQHNNKKQEKDSRTRLNDTRSKKQDSIKNEQELFQDSVKNQEIELK